MARVLVIEDNPANMKLTSLLLRNAGHVVLAAVDAEPLDFRGDPLAKEVAQFKGPN